VIVWQLNLQLLVQSVPITTDVVNSNPVRGYVYSIHYVMKFTSYLRQVDAATNKTNRPDITEILLKVALNTINQTKPIPLF